MKVVFHEKYFEVYASDPAASKGRLEPTVDRMKKEETFEFVKPEVADKKDILRAHTQSHYQHIKSRSHLYELAALSAGGAIKTAKLAYKEKDGVFGLIRPPGHHASRDSAWGFCFFNNMAVSLMRLYAEGKIKSAFILDFDLHTGDGNINIMEGREDIKVEILNPSASSEEEYLEIVKNRFEEVENVDILAASAGFDQGLDDWGDLLSPDAYETMGKWMKEKSSELCEGRRFALLEGGYSYDRVAINCIAFCKGFGEF